MIINMNGAKAPETPSSVLQEKTVTPETLPTVIGPDAGYDGLTQVTVNPDSQLKAENIRSGKTIFGVAGSFVGEPVYTDIIDYQNIVKGGGNEIGYPLCWVKSTYHTDFTNVDTPTQSRRVTATSYDFITLKQGLIGAYGDSNQSKPYMTTGSYVPSGTWHESTEVMSGEYNCYLSYTVRNHFSGGTHVTGTGWLCPTVIYHTTSSSDWNPTINFRNASVNVISGDVIEVNLDCELFTEVTPLETLIYFKVNIPEMQLDIQHLLDYGTEYGYMVTFAFIPNKLVIS